MLNRIMVRPRHALAECDPDVPYVVVSISDPPPFGEPARIPDREHCVGTLRLAFFDFDGLPPEGHAAYANMRDGRMQQAHGKALWGFLCEHPHVQALVVSCDAGMSRSPSTAKAVADCLGLARGCIEGLWDPTTEAANPHVYQTVRRFGPQAVR